MDNRLNTKNAVGRKPFGILYSSSDDHNRPTAVGVKGDIGRNAKHSSPVKSTFIFCDNQDENAGVDVKPSQIIENKPSSTFDPTEKQNIENVAGVNVDYVTASEEKFHFHLSDDDEEDENASMIFEAEKEITDEKKPSFILYDEEQDENAGVIIDQEMADVNKSRSSILCVSMHSIATPSYDLSADQLDKKARQDVIISCLDYAQDISLYLRDLEQKCRPKSYYMRKQPQIDISMRTVLVDWLMDVANEYDLCQETLHLAVGYTDRFLSIMAVRKEHLQLVGIASMMIAAKYEEIYPPELQDFVYITDDSYSKREVLQMEQIILKNLDFNLSTPTAYCFLISYLKLSRAGQRCQNLAKYLCDLALMDYSLLTYLPSLIAASCTFLAHYITDGLSEANKVQQISGYNGTFIYACVQAMITLFKKAPDHPQKAAWEKYKEDKYCRVSLLQLPESLDIM